MKKVAIAVFILFTLSLLPASYSHVITTITLGDNESMCKGRAGMKIGSSRYDQNIYDKCMEEIEQEAYLASPEYQQKLLEEKQAELEKKQAELEAKQKALEEQAIEQVGAKIEKIEKKMDIVEAQAFASLGNKASIAEAIAEVVKRRDEATQQKIHLILESFKLSKDEYTRNIGFYLGYLLR